MNIIKFIAYTQAIVGNILGGGYTEGNSTKVHINVIAPNLFPWFELIKTKTPNMHN